MTLKKTPTVDLQTIISPKTVQVNFRFAVVNNLSSIIRSGINKRTAQPSIPQPSTLGFSPSSGPGVKLFVNRSQSLLINVRINLRTGNVNVPEHLLDASQIGASR